MVQENLQINIGANTQDLQQGLNQATASVTNFSNSLNRATKPTADATNSLTNLNRIVQDAPYGFMGIANNLNPMLESFQRLSRETGSAENAIKSMISGLTGPAGIGIALAAVSLIVIKFGKDIENFFSSLNTGNKSIDEFNSAIHESEKAYVDAYVSINKLSQGFEDYHNGLLSKQEVLKLYNETLGDTYGKTNDVAEAERIWEQNSENFIKGAVLRAAAMLEIEKAAKKSAEAFEATLKPKEEFTSMIGFGGSGDPLTGPKATPQAGIDAQRKANQAETVKGLREEEAANLAVAEAINQKIKELKDSAVYTKFVGKDLPKESTTKQEVDTSRLDTLKKEQQLYKDDIYKFKDYADLIAEEEKKVALKRAAINKAGKEEIKAINDQYDIALKQNTKNLGIEIMKIADQNTKDFEKQEKEAKKKLLDSQEQASREALEIVKRQYDIDNKLAGDSYDKKREAIKKAMAQINILLALSSNPKAIVDLERSYKDLEKSFQILDIDEQQKNTKKLNDSYEKFAKTIATNVTNGLMTMWDAMQKGENPLKAIGDMLMGIVEQLAAAVIQALILETILEAFGAGGAAVGGGGFWKGVGKILGLADGGIVSSPTMAMVGEGGQSEAIMPLSKLGNMMNSTFAAGTMSGGNVGGGNGQFVLKGNDLVLALQRSNYSLNLRRGA